MIIPARGDLIWLDFDPQTGQEQSGRRPAIVLSEYAFNELTGFAVVCPITNQSKDYAFEIPLPDGLAFTGVVLTDQFKSLDYKKCKIKVAGNVSAEPQFLGSVLRNVRSILA
ncbi:type II toxin-antitoxin system PemK/MazF family toxin [Saccharibacillus sp. CPCC 101409]|uniref:type II toxin-antitoxin system PemK/MazF family toxin n=1 Tax=Saccharibacillus sp. CPCC 101409 TaxID=3058041 RepID=UPI002671CAAD|nr:type II toxin-antitoxin system PemK/MazF family toxin [Saccharibacillus sp. CPCC 101409]MDO3409899.1 type II toxin-antitoxin system PemK/MazF family toxin [Saccharibacillus sp. CPCC 101409]